VLLLDQDTKVTKDFFFTMLRHSHDLLPGRKSRPLPRLSAPQDVISRPAAIQLKRQTLQVSSRRVRNRTWRGDAINSGCIMRVGSLRYHSEVSALLLPDYSDVYVFHQFFVHGMKVWRAADVEIEHDLSILDYDRLMTPWRYRNFSYAETAFYDLY